MLKNRKQSLNAAPAVTQFQAIQRATSLVFYLHGHLHITRGADLLSELSDYIARERLQLPVEYCASLCMTVAGEYRPDVKVAA